MANTTTTAAPTSSSSVTITSQPRPADTYTALQAELQQLEAESLQLQAAEEQKMRERIQALKAANEARRSILTAAPVMAQPPSSVPAPSAAISSASPFPSLADLRRMDALNDQVNQQIFGNINAAAIASPAIQPSLAVPGPVPSTAVSAPVTGINAAATRLPAFQPSLAAPGPVPSITASAPVAGKNSVLSPENFARRPGFAELPYNRLSIQEFVVGTMRIVLQHPELSEVERKARQQHLMELMILASTYNWPAVRSLYGAALKEIEKGHRNWNDNLQDLKEEMLRPMDVTSARTPATDREAGICNAYNFTQGGCPRGAKCPYKHICEECFKTGKEEKHKARACPERNPAGGSKN